MRTELHFVYYGKSNIVAVIKLSNNLSVKFPTSAASFPGDKDRYKFGISYNVIYHFRVATTLEILSWTNFSNAVASLTQPCQTVAEVV
jgi:hypothetical protein